MKKIIKKLILPVVLQSQLADFVLAVPRLVCGLLLTLDFGSAKFGLPWSPPEKNLAFMEVAFWFPYDVAEYGGVFAVFPSFLAWMGAFSEAVGGVFLILGLFTRPFAFLTLCTMAVAVFMQQWGAGTWNMLPALGFLWVSLYLLILGSGRWGLDFWLPKVYTWLRRKKWGNSLIYLVSEITLIVLLVYGGVQDVKKQTVIIHAFHKDGVVPVTMALRGSDKPLSWDKDFIMVPSNEKGGYVARVNIYTGYAYTEMKLVRDGEFEFQDLPNRTIFFDADGTTEVDFYFNETQKTK